MSRPKRFSFPKFQVNNQTNNSAALHTRAAPSASAASSSTTSSRSSHQFPRPPAPPTIPTGVPPLARDRPTVGALERFPNRPDAYGARSRQQPLQEEVDDSPADGDNDSLSRMLVNLARTSSDPVDAAATVSSNQTSSRESRSGVHKDVITRNSRRPSPAPQPTTSELTEEELDLLVSDIDPSVFFDGPTTHSEAHADSLRSPPVTSLGGTRRSNPTIGLPAISDLHEFDAVSEWSHPSGATTSSNSRSTTSSGLGSLSSKSSTTSSIFAASRAGGRPQAAAVGVVRPMPSSTAVASNEVASSASSSSASAGRGLSEVPRMGRVAIGCVRPMRVVPPTVTATTTNAVTHPNSNTNRSGGGFGVAAAVRPQGMRSVAPNVRNRMLHF